ncbi:PREDICTED: phospholipase A2 inhibitor [Dufourea novaeangliae]|uniref:Trophoblast glycoprotein n=1 Tax=Dufourea novaeangliae TaxID=178035 RepID=A0A154PNR7_DUFNO|nr:PREDICTED: phospholipase A2 inhibitor [Dufourea novaeangliae]KZC13104.1 Trophoblast glycoprotein [Dufourea novaeangliae]
MKTLYAVFLLICFSTAQPPIDCDPNWHSLETLESAKLECGPFFQNRCTCMRTCYENRHQYVVNCTNSEFRNTEPLSHLPNETQVLIFTGNYLEELPLNVFGTLESFPDLRVIDMSNNKIREIRGKTYHHVQRVERLILDFNELSLDPGRNHPRVFSNFVSLLELHLTDAFEDGPPRDLAATLHDIFVNSNLKQLMKLHLEQNEISEFRDANVFCDLPRILDLYLGDNALTALHFNISCLHNLRFLDLQRNKFTKILDHDLRAMDAIVKHNQSLAVDFTANPLECSCKLNPFIKWMKKTKVFIRNKDSLKCYEGKTAHNIHETKNCAAKLFSTASRGATILLFFLSLILVGLICALIYVQRTKLQKKIEPILDSVNKRVRYTSIATGDAREDV